MSSSLLDSPDRYGTIELRRLNTPGAVVASFCVDTPAVSFGRDTSCSVRLYYPAVASTGARCTRVRTRTRPRRSRWGTCARSRYTGSSWRLLPVRIPRPYMLACH
ncbi:hypothetical protein DFH09DRAFT_1191665 [Mycena vulgaris]|nr:hypothetical protein DFH09DRAFT_1191665 [Mycena vulgaris]